MIIELISVDNKKLTDKSLSLIAFLEQTNYNDSITHEKLLIQIGVTEDEYIQLL